MSESSMFPRVHAYFCYKIHSMSSGSIRPYQIPHSREIFCQNPQGWSCSLYPDHHIDWCISDSRGIYVWPSLTIGERYILVPLLWYHVVPFGVLRIWWHYKQNGYIMVGSSTVGGFGYHMANKTPVFLFLNDKHSRRLKTCSVPAAAKMFTPWYLKV